MRENPFQSEKFLSFYSCTRNAGLFDLLCKNCCSLLGLLNLLYSCEIRKASVLWAALRCQSRNSCRSREESRVFLGGVGFLTILGGGVGFFFWILLRMSNWIIFYITLLNWEFLLKWYNFFWNLCWNRFHSLHHDFHWFQVRNFTPLS